MRRILPILLVLALGLSSCASYSDIRITSFKLLSVSPQGFTSLGINAEIGVDNPAGEIRVKDMKAVIKMKGEPCLDIVSDGCCLEKKSSGTYNLPATGTVAGDLNLFRLLSVLSASNVSLDDFSVDLSCTAVLKGGISKKLKFDDVPLAQLMNVRR